MRVADVGGVLLVDLVGVGVDEVLMHRVNAQADARPVQAGGRQAVHVGGRLDLALLVRMHHHGDADLARLGADPVEQAGQVSELLVAEGPVGVALEQAAVEQQELAADLAKEAARLGRLGHHAVGRLGVQEPPGVEVRPAQGQPGGVEGRLEQLRLVVERLEVIDEHLRARRVRPADRGDLLPERHVALPHPDLTADSHGGFLLSRSATWSAKATPDATTRRGKATARQRRWTPDRPGAA